METQLDVDCMHAVAKGKRTKRHRGLFSPAPRPSASPASSAEISGSTTEEEEDMANCLILLARGRARDREPPAPEVGGGRRFPDGGNYVYECKTCNKCFPSFQALGGHRASHKRPKLASGVAPAAAAAHEIDEEDALQISLNSFSAKPLVPLPAAGGKAKIHECSICGAEFSSGQALGGHMRRHRPLNLPTDAKKERPNVLSLDLNLPAPSDDNHNEFARPPPPPPLPLLVSASALVDCHY